MTLVILFEKAAVMVGDLMASTTNPEVFDKAPIKVRNKEGAPLYSARPVQKIIRIQDRFHIAYSGSMLDAEKINNYAHDLPWPLIPTGGFGRTAIDATIRPLITEIRNYRDQEVPRLDLIISMDGFQCCMMRERPVPTPVGPAWVIGHGIDDFRRFVRQRTGFGHGRWAFPEQACLTFGLSFFATHLFEQSAGGASLRNRWGLGMEMLSRGAKVDRILIQAFLWERSDGREPRFEQFGDKIFHYYRGDILISLRQRADGQWGAYKAEPLTGDGLGGLVKKTVLKDVPDSPRLTCILFINRSDFTVSPHIRYVEAGDSACSISTTRENGAITYPPQEVSKRFAETFGK
jgi:hypothetical protein